MPGKDNEVTIADKTWELTPLAGLKAIRMMPKVISVAAEVLWAATDAGFPLIELFSGELDSVGLTSVLKAMKFVADTLGKRFDELALEIVPFLLQQDQQWLQSHGSMEEIGKALWIAGQYHIKTSFGEEVIEALKKSVAAEEEEAAEEQDSESNKA